MFFGVLLGLLFVTPFVVFYALVVRWCDRFEPEPWWLLGLAFVWGAVFATLGGGVSSAMVQGVAASVTGFQNHTPDMDALGATVLAPVLEEGFKGLGVALIALASALGLHELDGPLDGVIYGGIVGLGFTLTEDVLYVAHQFADSGFGGFVSLFFLRTVLLGLSHCTFTAMTGLGFGLAAEARTMGTKIAAPLLGYVIAMAMHAFHNALPTYFGGGGLIVMLIVSWAIDVLFFALLAMLVVRDRAIVVRELATEIGPVIHPQELALVTTYLTIGMRNIAVLLARGWGPFRLRRDKQLALVELAFIKNRRRRGEFGPELDVKEMRLRRAIDTANQMGVWLG